MSLAFCSAALMWSNARAQADVESSDWAAEKQAMTELGKRHATGWDLYLAFKDEAGERAMAPPEEVPDWSGIWARQGGADVIRHRPGRKRNDGETQGRIPADDAGADR